MGRGRQKAKQTKVARELKYHTPSTDYAALQRELAGGSVSPPPAPVNDAKDEDDEFSAYAAYNVDDDEPAEDYISRALRR